jgi:hypothetical protein
MSVRSPDGRTPTSALVEIRQRVLDSQRQPLWRRELPALEQDICGSVGDDPRAGRADRRFDRQIIQS